MDMRKIKPLVEKSIQGDKQSYSALCEAIIRDVLYICVRITGDMHQAEDAAQEALLRLGSSIRRLRDPQAFPLWLNRHITNSCRDYLRRERRYSETGELFEEIMEQNADFLPQEWAEQKDTRQLVLGCLQDMPPRQQHILLMFYFQDMSLREIAQTMKVNENTARGNLHYARKSLKKRIEKKQGSQLANLPTATIPTLTAIFQRDAAGLITQESSKKVLLAVSTALAGTATTVAGVQIATLVASIAPAAAAIIIAAAIPLASSPSPSHPPEDVIGITPQYSNSVSTQGEGEGDLYMSEPDEQILQSRHSSSEKATSADDPEPASPKPSSNPIPHTVSGQVQLADGQGAVVEHEELSLRGICVQAYYGNTLAAEDYTDSEGEYTLDLPDNSLAYTLRIAHNARPLIGRQESTVLLQPGYLKAPVIYITDTVPPSCVIRLLNEQGEPRSQTNPTEIELTVYDATPCDVVWEIRRTNDVETVVSGTDSQIAVAELGLQPGNYTLVFTTTDLCGNQTLTQKEFTIR